MPGADPVFQGPCFHDPSHTLFWVWPWGFVTRQFSLRKTWKIIINIVSRYMLFFQVLFLWNFSSLWKYVIRNSHTDYDCSLDSILRRGRGDRVGGDGSHIYSGHFNSLTPCGHLIPKKQKMFSSVQLLSHVWLFATPWTAARQASHPSPTPRVYSNSRPLSQQPHPTISSSVVCFSSCLQSFPASGSFLMSQFFTSGGQSIGVSASASVLPMNIQDWFPLRWTGWISLQTKEVSRFFSSTVVQKHQFFSTQLSLYSSSHIHTWLLEKP